MSKLFFSRQFIWEILRIVSVGLACLLFSVGMIPLQLLFLAIAFGAYSLAKTALSDLFRDRKIGTELFICIAVAVSMLGREYLAGAIVLMIILIAEYISTVSSEQARASIRSLIGTVPKTALVKANGREELKPIDQLKIGDVILVKAGDKIPVDGRITAGQGSVNEAAITGESLPKEKSEGNEVFAGTIVELGAIDIAMTKAGQDTVFSRIIQLVEEAENEKAPIEKLTDKIAAWLVPIVFLFVGAVYFYTRDAKLIVALLIFSSPAELGLATPLVTISAIVRAAREGILVKGGLYFEELSKVSTVVFDKTGTLTVGKPVVRRMEITDKSCPEEQLIQWAAAADRRSSHPLAKAILDYADGKGIRIPEPETFQVVKGRGVSATVGNQMIRVGNQAFMEENNIPVLVPERSGDTSVYVSNEGRLAGIIFISDAIREGAGEMIVELKKSGVKRIVMLTGDNEQTAREVAEKIGITEFEANLLPEEKIQRIKTLQKESKVAMVGDGINDAPALVQAHVGIAMGTGGTEVAMEAADIVLMQDKLEKIARTRAISKKAFRTIKENIIVGVGVVHVTGIVLVLLKIIGPVEAAMIHLVPDTLVFLNSIKLLKVRIQ